MTTTLRPAGAERRLADGGRVRSYDVCVNGRPVGAVELGTDERSGPSVGRIRSLRIDEPDRRRGRGTVAALAAEEVLRGWGCRGVEAAVPAPAEGACRLATALGYVERNRNLAKELGQAPRLPAGSRARPMTAAEYPAWLAAERAGHVRSWVEHGMPGEEAERRADVGYRGQLPDGPATDGVALRVLAHDGADVGTLWVALRPAHTSGGYVFSVEVRAGYRGRGHGRTLMLLAERECLAAGRSRIGLNVFAGNGVARRLADALGYRPTAYHLYKPLL